MVFDIGIFGRLGPWSHQMPTEMEPSENSIQLTGFGALDKVGLKEKSLWVLNI